MTKNRGNPQRSHPPGNPSSPESTTEAKCPVLSDNVRRIENSDLSHRQQAECPELSGIVRRIENSNLSHRQQAVLPVMASAPSLAQAARISGFAERTLRRWLDDDDFRGELTRLRQESSELARLELQGLMLRSVSVLSQAMDDPEKAIRLSAARYAMSFAVRVCETEKLKKDIQDLEDAVALCNPQPPVKYQYSVK